MGRRVKITTFACNFYVLYIPPNSQKDRKVINLCRNNRRNTKIPRTMIAKEIYYENNLNPV